MDQQTGKDKFRVLFLCEGNTCRSQMAEGLVKNLLDERLEVLSSGYSVAASQVSQGAIGAMQEIGIDISLQKPKNDFFSGA